MHVFGWFLTFQVISSRVSKKWGYKEFMEAFAGALYGLDSHHISPSVCLLYATAGSFFFGWVVSHRPYIPLLKAMGII